MAYKALYREYRPQTFDEVVGQQQIVQTLKNSIKDNRIAHAYLFTGPRGTGKTTFAKLIAKAVNCTCEGEKPCGKCKNCQDIANGVYPDVIEIDAASNNSVDEAREIIEQVKYAPVSGKYKVYIIDEVHMMTSGAFNALLKTLEEPPEHVIFIFATTEVHKVLPTIISRCQRFDFGRVSEEDLEKKVREVLIKEEISFEKDAPSLIARLADGGVRDALSILDQAISYSGSNLTCKDIREIYGVVSASETIEFIEKFNNQDVNACLLKIDEFDKKGIDIVRFTNYLIDVFKELIIYCKTRSFENVSLLNDKELNDLARMVSIDNAFEYIDILFEATLNYKKISSPKSYFELTCLKLCNCNKTTVQNVAVETVVEESKSIENNSTFVEKEEISAESTVESVKEEVNEEPQTFFNIEETTNEVLKDDSVEESLEEEPINEKIEDDPQETIETFKVSKNEDQFENSDTVSLENVVPAAPITDNYEIKQIILNYMVNGSKEYKQSLERYWESIGKYVFKPLYAKAANYLRDGSIVVASEKGILIQMDTEQEAFIARSPEMYYECKALIKELLQKDFAFFTISRDQFKSAKAAYISAMGNNSLPEPKEIKDIYSEEACKAYMLKGSVEPKETKEESLGKEIFGDLFKV